MKPTNKQLEIKVLDANKRVIQDAQVILQSPRKEFVLQYDKQKRSYVLEEWLQGQFKVYVNRKPYESEERSVSLSEDNLTEIFFLRRKDTPFYYRGRVKVPFTFQQEKFAVVFPEGKEEKSKSKKGKSSENRVSAAETLAKKYNLVLEKPPQVFIDNNLFIFSLPRKLAEKNKLEIISRIENELGQNSALPILELSETGASLLTNEIMVKFEHYVEREEVEEIAKKHNLRIKRKISALGNFFHFTTDKTPTYEVLSIISKLAESEEVVFAEPNMVSTVEEDAVTPTDFLFPEQWDHQILNTPDAWQFLRNTGINRTFGSPNMIIGIVDSGVDPNHPDLTGTVSDGSAKVYQSFDFANMVANNNSLASGHGTSCASAASARVNNASAVAGTNEGVAGVAGNCRIMAVRRGGTEARYADMYLWAAGIDPESDIANFPAAISPGADILSNSFGFSIGSVISGTMSAVFDRLTDDGRNGLGTLLFFSAGNNTANNPNGQDLDLTFFRPWGMYNRCFSVAASTLANDGITENKAPYSCFGSVIEFCAPSNRGGSHNPPTTFGAFTATPIANPEGDGTVGRPTISTALNAAANAGNTVVTLNTVAGMANGQAIMFGNPGAGNTEAHLITAINAAMNRITLNRPLFNNHPTGTGVFVANRDYRSNFGGTSHATPLSAGTAALMLSANPQLTWTQVRDILRNTAVKINPNEAGSITTRSDADGTVLGTTSGRWQDINGNQSNDPAYNGIPVFSNFYGFGRIDTATAVRQAGWDIELVTTNLNFNDVVAGEESARAIRFNVKSLWPANFHMTSPGVPFGTPLGTSAAIGSSTDANVVREVYLWVTFRGTSPGDTITAAAGFSVTVTNPETEQEWVIPVTANTIARTSAGVMLSLDRSNSMNFASGIGTSKRIDILRFSANILADVIQEGNGLGIVAYDHDPYDVLPMTGPLPENTPFDAQRVSIKAAINSFSPNPQGWTSIGNGIERAQIRLNPVTDYDTKSIIVFTDGYENRPKYIADVEELINDRVFAVGLGKAANIRPAALNEITNNKGGYLLLTDELDENSIFKLAKYFLQILAGVNNEEIVVDPNGTIFSGQEHKIPFVLNEADISSDVILMLPSPDLIDLALETPNGHIINPHHSGVIPGVSHYRGNQVGLFRLNLPVALGSGEKEGTWKAILKINRKYEEKYKGHRGELNVAATSSGIGKGIPYTLLVHSYSNLKMAVQLSQDHYEPGATIRIHVHLSQYGIPLNKDAYVRAEITTPSGQGFTRTFQKEGVGQYLLKIEADAAGIYRFRIMASGTTFRNRNFTREQVRTAAVWRGGNNPDPRTNENPERDLCRLIKCLVSEKNLSREFKELMLKRGINIDGIIDCLSIFCEENRIYHSDIKLSEKISELYDQLSKLYRDKLIE